jgi:hypothetical protein
MMVCCFDADGAIATGSLSACATNLVPGVSVGIVCRAGGVISRLQKPEGLSSKANPTQHCLIAWL